MRVILVAVLVVCGCGVTSTPDVARPRARQPVLSCPQSPAKEAFGARALCLCGDLRAVGDGVVVTGGSVGVNGQLDVVGSHRYLADVEAFGGVSGVGDLRVEGSLTTAGRVESTGALDVTGDLVAGSGVCGAGALTVGGTLAASNAWTGPVSVGSVSEPRVVSSAPCGCEAKAVDVAARIAQAKRENDNQRAGLGAHERVGDHSTRLGSGSYSFDGVSTVGEHELVIDGAVALFVAGDFEAVGGTHLRLTPGSTLELFVEGDLSVVGESSFGEGATPGAVRLYVGGGLSFVGTQTFSGSIYAPQADLGLVGDSRVEGALFVRSVEGVGSLEVKAAPQQVVTPDDARCQPAPVVTLN